MRRRYAAWLAAGVALLLAGCGLSTTSRIQQGMEVGAEPESEVRVDANPVAPGSTPEQVVTGFIRAAAASDDQYQVARSYLADETAASWRPDTSVVVFTSADSALEVTKATPDTVRAVVNATARIDGQGRYHELAGERAIDATFEVGKIDGEWRITKLPKDFGVWLSGADLDRLYDAFRIYYVSATERRLVPDVRWFPLGTGLATRLAKALLEGVPAYLTGAVRTDIPGGTQLAVDAVTIDSGLASVDLTGAKISTNPGIRQNLGAQFLATVGQAPGVDRVTLKLDGSDLQIPGADSGLDSLSALGFPTPADPPSRPVLREGSTLSFVNPDQLFDPERSGSARDTTGLPTLQPGWSYAALSPNGEEVAAVSGDRAQLARWRRAERIQTVSLGARLTRPAYDREGLLWVSGRAGSKTRVWVVNTNAQPNTAAAAQPAPVATDWLEGRLVLSQRISPDGQRLALLSTDLDGRDPKVQVAGVRREPNGIPSALAEPLDLAASLSLVRDAVWVDDSTLAVLGRKNATQVIRPWFVPLGGPVSAGPELAGALSITTVNGERGLVVTTDAKRVLLRAGNRWQRIGSATDVLVPAR